MLTALSLRYSFGLGILNASAKKKRQALRSKQERTRSYSTPGQATAAIQKSAPVSQYNGAMGEDPKGELHRKQVAMVVLVVDALLVATLLVSDGALNWLANVPFLGGVMKIAGPFITVATLVQLGMVLVFYTANLLLGHWKAMNETHGGPKPNASVAVGATISLLALGTFVLPHEKHDAVPVEETRVITSRPRPPTSAASNVPSAKGHLPTVFRLQRQMRSSGQDPQEFAVGTAVTDIELRTPIAYALIAAYSITLDQLEVQSYQIRNGELSVTVDRERLPPGRHTLTVVTINHASHRSDTESLSFYVVDI